MDARRARRAVRPPRCGGFSLVELIVVIVVAGIVATVVAGVIVRPTEGYIDLSRRAGLVDAAEAALQRLARDIRRALPNSIRVSGGNVIEMISVADAARYRDDPPPGDPDKRLELTQADEEFNALGLLNNLSFAIPDCPATVARSDLRLVVYHTGDAGADAYADDPVITPAGRQLDFCTDTGLAASDDEHHIRIAAPGHRFTLESPAQRIYAVDTPVTYHCDDATANDVVRFWDYPIQDPQLTSRGALQGEPGVREALLTEHVTGCRFTYQPGTSQRAGLVTLEIELSNASETITLLHQVHVGNAP
ncbi:MAG: prepilin-type N-terminal cleavage/methylation domain-containing protein [Gammaproteobacteria bacterium]|nr:prepilin-type N-terminal cleavage/methylation domain-containing protein [Gammaproteobacteria bacterium]